MIARSPLALTGTAAALLLGLTACADGGTPAASSAPAAGSASSAAPQVGDDASDGKVTLYSGRDENLVQPVLDQFSEETGIEVEVRYDKTAAMAAQLIEEGDSSPADVFLAQDAGALGATAKEGVLTEMDEKTLEAIPEQYRDDEGRWVGLTGRVRVLAYNEDAVAQEDLPDSVSELTEDEWKGRVGIAPTNASFQTFVTALNVVEGEDAAREWLTGMAENNPQIREKNGEILSDVDAGTIDVGLINHYYLYEMAKEKGVAPEDMTASLHFFEDGDLGSLVNVSGIGLVGEQEDADAQQLVDYLLSEKGQQYFVEETFEYPMIEGVEPPAGLPALEDLEAPDVDLNDLDDLQSSVQLIQESGLL
ncbi:iron ABC transporter substrate-binding protein [Micrococcus flavus]|uniref:Iron(III) transport system substrate-binding protein n=1 Tax=Micrococcus flavus TaxID=384602 RepID=A0A4Y8X2Z9_9MICC|nr:iron ABC transporter substrate-binding protein [Micrococcus flavus]MBB4883219.1 iron(III) transport system substrate-binding protein [Micrococcus flavus]TFI03776.1 iron ABC transporter substrate-binding protein [Micrococcus flavus]GGK43392.1 iron ABC transporter substrate-binding protein [Micrococcus flavus]